MEMACAKGFVFMALSLDGFIARQDNSLDWLMKYGFDEEHKSFETFSNSMHALLMGSGTFKTILGFVQNHYRILNP